MRRRIALGYFLPCLAFLLTARGARAMPAPVQVTVNQTPVVFEGQPPVEQGGRVLVPLRGIFERLGASVRYEAPTKTVTATRNATHITLPVGSRRAVVGDQPVTLDVPAFVANGSVLVPLRFVGEALGAQVRWDAATRTVQITTGAPVAEKLPAPPGTEPITGTITGIFPEASAVTVRVTGGENTRLPLAPDVYVAVKSGEGPAVKAELAALRVGDQVTVRRDPQGRATLLEAAYNERKGEVKSIQRVPSSGNYIVTLSDSSVVEVVSSAPVSMAGREVQLTDVQPGERVVIRLNPQTQQGIGVAVVTADNPAPTPPAPPEVSSLTHSAARPLRGGDVLTVTLKGTPGAEGAFSVPGIEAAQSLALKETAPGAYTGTFTVPNGINVKEASVLASLTVKGVSSRVIQAGTPLTIDAAGPTLASLSPEDGATVPPGKPLLYGTYADAGTGVDPKATRLVVNGQDVTEKATITEAFFSYRPDADLPAGKNTARVTAKDAAGNETQKEWAFTVAGGLTPIKNLTFSPEGKTLAAGDVLTVRLEAAPGGTARFSVGGVATDRPLKEGAVGVYTGTYAVKKGDSLEKAPVAVTYTSDAGRTVTQTADQPVTIAAGAPDAPIIDTPQEGASVGNTVTVTGRAAPGATVRVSIAYRGRLLVIPARGTVADVEVKADEKGKWTAPDIKLGAPPGVSGLSYTLRAVAVNAAGGESDAATVQFKR